MSEERERERLISVSLLLAAHIYAYATEIRCSTSGAVLHVQLLSLMCGSMRCGAHVSAAVTAPDPRPCIWAHLLQCPALWPSCTMHKGS